MQLVAFYTSLKTSKNILLTLKSSENHSFLVNPGDIESDVFLPFSGDTESDPVAWNGLIDLWKPGMKTSLI